MRTPTDEWLVTVLEDYGYMRRFVIHHDPGDFEGLASRAVQTAIATYSGGAFNAPGHWVHIISIVNQGVNDEGSQAERD